MKVIKCSCSDKMREGYRLPDVYSKSAASCPNCGVICKVEFVTTIPEEKVETPPLVSKPKVSQKPVKKRRVTSDSDSDEEFRSCLSTPNSIPIPIPKKVVDEVEKEEDFL